MSVCNKHICFHEYDDCLALTNMYVVTMII